MEKRQPPTFKVFIFPFVFATLLAGSIAYFAPQLGAMAWGSAWIGAFMMLGIWGLVTR